MLDPSEVMPPSTARLFPVLSVEPEIRDFYLIGGTALALHLGHRLSEDLDFITTAPTLPRERIDRVIAKLRANHLSVQRNDSDAAYDDFQNAGMALHDYSQNFIVADACKLTFFAADEHHRKLLTSDLREAGPTVASLSELRDLKAIVCASRSSSRDWLDLYTLAKQDELDLCRWKLAFEKAGMTANHFETALTRIRSGTLPSTDPGFASLLPNPPTIQEITSFLMQVAERD